MKVYYSPAYVLAAHSFDTTRKAEWVAESLRREPIAGVHLCEPDPLDETGLADVHAPEYVAAVRTGEPRALAESQGFTWDPGLWPMVCASNGGAVAAALSALDDGVAGSLSSGLHHAARGWGAGFCTFNGLALAARPALRSGATSVLVVDLDAHCGGGTHSLIRDDPRIRQLDVSVDSFDGYAATAGTTLDIVTDARRYLETIRARLGALDGRFDLCIFNAGMDPFEHNAIGGLEGITSPVLAEREREVFGWCRRKGVPAAFVLAGGYVGPGLREGELVGLHRMTVAAALAK